MPPALVACSPEGALVPERARLVTVTAPTRPGAGRDAPRATPWPAAAGGGQPGHDAGAGGGLGQTPSTIMQRVQQSRAERLEGASALLERLIAALAAAAHRQANRHAAEGVAAHAAGLVNDPAGESLIGGAEMLGWLRRLTRAPVGTARYEQELAQRSDPDWFGLRALPAAPPFLAGTDPAARRPELLAPLLRPLSLTPSAPAPEELTSAALDADPGPVTRVRRGAPGRRSA